MRADEGFLQAIIDDPDDDSVRLIYADWLDDHGDPARAEFIRVQIELSRLPEDDDRRPELETREGQLLAEHRDEWIGASPCSHGIRSFRRGFVDEIVLDARLLIVEASRSLAHLPIQRLTVSLVAGCEEALARCAFLSRVRELNWHPEPLDLSVLLGSPHLARLRALGLPNQQLSTEVAEKIGLGSFLPGLTSLDLNRSRLGLATFEALTGPGLRGRLKQLELRSCGLTNLHAHALAGAGPWRELSFLDLSENEIREAGARSLGQLFHESSLTTLDLSGNALGNAGVEQLARSPRLASLRWLNLGSNHLVASAAGAIADSLHLKNLVFLGLGGNRIGDEGARMLASSPNVARLETLYLPGNEIGDAGAESLGDSPHLVSLCMLYLSANGLRVLGLKKLLAPGKLAGLQLLDLSGNCLGDMGVQVLARTPHLEKLRSLRLRNNRITAAGIKELTEIRNLPCLRELKLGGNDIDDEVARVLLASPLCRQLTRLDLTQTDITPALLAHIENIPQSNRPRKLELGLTDSPGFYRPGVRAIKGG
jgi:uncharacterized protein (TIGR02996 family)